SRRVGCAGAGLERVYLRSLLDAPLHPHAPAPPVGRGGAAHLSARGAADRDDEYARPLRLLAKSLDVGRIRGRGIGGERQLRPLSLSGFSVAAHQAGGCQQPGSVVQDVSLESDGDVPAGVLSVRHRNRLSAAAGYVVLLLVFLSL